MIENHICPICYDHYSFDLWACPLCAECWNRLKEEHGYEGINTDFWWTVHTLRDRISGSKEDKSDSLTEMDLDENMEEILLSTIKPAILMVSAKTFEKLIRSIK